MIHFDANTRRPFLKRLLVVGLCLGVVAQATGAWARFVPKRRIGQAPQRIGLASRGTCGVESQSKPLTTIVPLVSSFTATQKPNLIWFMPQHTFPSVEVRVFATSEMGFNIVHRKVFENLPKNQIVNYDLATEDVTPLEADKTYKWQVHLVCDPDDPGGNIFAEGWIEYEAPSASLMQQLNGSTDSQKADLWLENGYWYEGIQALWSQVKTEPSPSTALEHWQALMTDELVDLPYLATFETDAVD